MPPMSSNKPHIRRAQIRRALEEAGRPVTRRQLSHVFGLDKAQSDQRLSPVLMEMVAAGELVRNRRAAYGFPSQMDLVPGRISAHPRSEERRVGKERSTRYGTEQHRRK